MRVLICGGRDFADKSFVWSTLDRLHGRKAFSLVITGAAPGADTHADTWAAAGGIDRALFPANWIGRGNPAGPHRNALMLDFMRPQVVIAFPSRGTGTPGMCRLAEAAGVPVRRIER